jgi:uncharacterized membrane protein
MAPFVAASALRMMFGKNRKTRLLLSVSVMWFAMNVLIAPYSAEVQQDLSRLGNMLH